MNKKIVRTVVVVVIAVLVIAAVVLHEKNKNTKNNNETTVTQTTADANGKTDEQANDTKEYATLEDITETTGDSETNYFDNVSVYEGEGTTKKAGSSKKNKKKNNKNQETESEAYEGQNDGWSPVVSPEDLGQ